MILLASESPRRKDILSRLGISYRTVSYSFDESVLKKQYHHNPLELVRALACGKLLAALEVLDIQQNMSDIVLAADTLVIYKNKVLNKPKNRSEAKAMLCALSGSKHQVATALACSSAKKPDITSRLCVSSVYCRTISQKEMEWYLDTNEWCGVAGAYRIQERGAFFVSCIEGSHSGIEGLPLFEFYEILAEHNFSLDEIMPISR